MDLAPIALFVYRRPQHTDRVLAALAENPDARHSDLYIFSDGPRDAAAAADVQAVRRLCSEVKGFRSCTLIERPQNLGLARSIVAGVSQICGRYGKVIVLEDDIVASRAFLRFMNDALSFYQNTDEVISVSAYLLPLRTRMPETFFLRHPDCWGWGTWQRGWALFEPDGSKLLQGLISQGLLERFDYYGAYPYAQMLRDQIAGRNDSWAIRWYASGLLHDKLTLYAGRSLVLNIGTDGSGTHCGESSAYDAPLEDGHIAVGAIPSTENKQAVRASARFYRSLQPTPLDRVRARVARLFGGTASTGS